MSSPGRDSRPRTDETAAFREELDDARRLVVELETEIRSLRSEVERLQNSSAGRVVSSLQRAARRAAPPGTRRQLALHTAARSAVRLLEDGPRVAVRSLMKPRGLRTPAGEFPDTPAGRQQQYREWLRCESPDAAALRRMRQDATAWAMTPLISVILPVYESNPRLLEKAVASVLDQAYPAWELCIADDGSKNSDLRPLLEQSAGTDTRIRVTFESEHRGIAATTNAALALARGEFVMFLDHDDVLRPHALYALVAYLRDHPAADLVYSDEDMILANGEHAEPMFKPDYSPEMLLSCNYITHPVLIRRELVAALGGLREGFEGSQDHDLLLRVVERAREVGHVPDVLYGWRKVAGSAALSADQKPLARESGRRAVEQAIQRRGFTGKVRFGSSPGFYDVRYDLGDVPSVAIVIPTRDRIELLRTCIRSIEERSTYPRYTITIVNNGSRSSEALRYLESAPYNVLDVDEPFNFSSLVNAASRSVEAEHLLLLNNDTTVLTPDWIEAMVEHSQHADVGAVGARLLFPDGRVQHEGIVLGRLHVAANAATPLRVVREVSAVTGACFMTRRAVFDQLGGFDEAFVEAFNDVDYCLRARGAGYRVIYTPLAELTHREGATRGRRTPGHDNARFVARWGSREELEDPYLNRNVLWPEPLRLRFS